MNFEDDLVRHVIIIAADGGNGDRAEIMAVVEPRHSLLLQRSPPFR